MRWSAWKCIIYWSWNIGQKFNDFKNACIFFSEACTIWFGNPWSGLCVGLCWLVYITKTVSLTEIIVGKCQYASNCVMTLYGPSYAQTSNHRSIITFPSMSAVVSFVLFNLLQIEFAWFRLCPNWPDHCCNQITWEKSSTECWHHNKANFEVRQVSVCKWGYQFFCRLSFSGFLFQ